MKKELQDTILEKVGNEVYRNGFHLVDASRKRIIFHRKNDSYVEIIQIAQDKYETFVSVSASIAFLNVPNEIRNMNHVFFNEFNNGNIKRISTDDCCDKFFLRGNFGESFHFGDVYLALGQGIVGVNPGSKKPIGIRLKKYNSETYDKSCDLIIKRLKKAYCWLDIKKQGVQ
ncbi:MAG: hypothetical protein J6J01_08950 [Oscillospiraceae bacterium]|nr:hypothetical protein [Clostridia bacterium]MBP3699584.1 hypothetical protein [Oscillospiraceae bacterium]